MFCFPLSYRLRTHLSSFQYFSWFPNAPRGSTSNPLAQFTAKDHTRKQLIAQNPEKMARTSTYPFYYRQAEPGRDAKLWAPRRATSHDPYHPGEVLAGWDNA